MEEHYSNYDINVAGRSVLSLLNDWDIEPRDQILLLGLPENTCPRALLRYLNGTPLPMNNETLGRIGELLSIQNSLEVTFPHNASLANIWVTTTNAHFNNQTPLDLMLTHGLNGIRAVAQHLNHTDNW